ncbi:MAG: dienelactone hydrolase family protein [Polyangiaceae bacterium]|nr:dienelactone hydrolase family protein [Polyangiaceae bacterium]
MIVSRATVQVPSEDTLLEGDLASPDHPSGLVVFAHGSGSSRHSPRNRRVAEALHRAQIATLLMDLLTLEEEAVDVRTAEYRFDIDLLISRVIHTIDWLEEQWPWGDLPIGVFGASTGAAAALGAAAARPERVVAVVSRGGRPDMAGSQLQSVRAPTLLIVGGRDDEVLRLNVEASRALAGDARVEVVAGATHLFEEPGALDEVARLAADWFELGFAKKRERPRPRGDISPPPR